MECRVSGQSERGGLEETLVARQVQASAMVVGDSGDIRRRGCAVAAAAMLTDALLIEEKGKGGKNPGNDFRKREKEMLSMGQP